MIKPENLLKHELIGLECEIKDSKNKSQIGLKGKVINETKNTLQIKTKDGNKKIEKATSKFTFKIPSGKKVTVDGSLLVGKPEIRVKKRLPKKRV